MATERRPISAREWPVSAAAAACLVRRGVSANAISVMSAVFGVGAGVALWWTPRGASSVLWLAAAVLIGLRLVANMLDGMVALAGATATRAGELYNEVPDRLSDSAVLIGLGYAAGGSVALGYGAALAAMFTAYVRTSAKAAGAPMDFGGPMAKPQRMAVVAAAAVLSGTFHLAHLPAAALALITAGSIVTAVARLRRAAGALR
jgi:phosphatidylglycerophosphate synthase